MGQGQWTRGLLALGLTVDELSGPVLTADELGLDHQVCEGHVKRNTEGLSETLELEATADAEGSLGVILPNFERPRRPRANALGLLLWQALLGYLSQKEDAAPCVAHSTRR